MRVLWFVFLFSQVMFLFVLYAAKPEVYDFDSAKPALGENAAIVIVLGVLAIGNLGLSFAMKKYCFAQAAAEQNTRYVQTGLILACAFCESISLIGLVLAFAFSYQYFFLWFALGIFGILLHFPRRKDLIFASYKK